MRGEGAPWCTPFPPPPRTPRVRGGAGGVGGRARVPVVMTVGRAWVAGVEEGVCPGLRYASHCPRPATTTKLLHTLERLA